MRKKRFMKSQESFVYQFCMVGQCLTDSVVHFPSLCNTMADLWHPTGGICITEVGEKRVKAGTPWFFNNHLLILQTILEGVNPAVVELKFTEFWIQVHDLPPGSMNESMAKQFGSFSGKFLEYETSVPTLGTQIFLRTRVCLDLGTENYDGSRRDRSGYDGGDVQMGADGAVYGSLELVSSEEDDPIALLEGKKRQRMGESSRMPLETIGGSGFMDVSASSEKLGGQLLRWGRLNSREDKKKRLALEDRLSMLYKQDISDEVLAEITEENNRIKGHDIGTSWITVDQLIEGSTWNRELIHKLVDSETANRILTIPISDSRPEDIRVWKFEGTGEYTVKSDYRAIVTELLQNKPNLSPKTEEYRRFYQGLWKLDIPAKIKIYMWRLFHNLVPHYENLARRTLCEEAVCPLCKTELETSDHLLWACVILQDIWDALKEVLGFIRGYVQELSLHNTNSNAVIGFAVNECWRPPDDGLIKINFDAAFSQDTGLATIAVLARDYKGEVVGGETYLVLNVADSFMAEARACERALKVNEAAHALAIEGRRKGVGQIWTNDVPELVQMVVRKDRIAWNSRLRAR
ncbi:hypothetical protein GOBAR_DD07047 [Gossypium barbadense]|nr:hypothetical protein GOBAR_DD07047 [Gossypium barbadense]